MKRMLPEDSVSQMQGHPFKRPKFGDALSYVGQVKYKFRKQPQVYKDFVATMKEFSTESIDTVGVIQRITHMFSGHLELLVGFNAFLPFGYRIEVLPDDHIEVTMHGEILEGVVIPGPSSSRILPSGPPAATHIHPGQSSLADHSPAKSLLSFSGLFKKEPSDSSDSTSIYPTDRAPSHHLSHERSSVISNLFGDEPSGARSTTANQPTERPVSNRSSPATSPLSFEGLFKKEPHQ